MTNLCTTEISVAEDQGGFFVHLTVNGKLEATKGPFTFDVAYMLAKELADRAADTPNLVSGRSAVR